MTLFALPSKCGFFGASGFRNGVAPSAAAACCAKKPSSSRPARARPVKPAPASHRNCRRVRPQGGPVNLRSCLLIVISSVMHHGDTENTEGHREGGAYQRVNRRSVFSTFVGSSCLGVSVVSSLSIQVKEFVQVQGHDAETFEG